MAPPILLCGDVLGRCDALCKRLAIVNKANGPFDALLCVGQFFPNNIDGLDEMKHYIEGHKEFPLPTYFIGDFGEGVGSILSAAKLKSANEGFKMEGIPVCKNLYWLKGSGRFILHGLSIVYLAGRSPSGGLTAGLYCEDDIDAVRAFAEESGIVDLFLTNEWPQGILNGVNLAEASPGIEHISRGNSVISELVAELKPRYHIAGSEGIFYSREPYANNGASHVTRFLGLAAVGNVKKEKFIHALSPVPASMMPVSELLARPPNSTPSPYKAEQPSVGAKDTNKRTETSDAQYWRYDVSKKRQRGGTEDGERLCFQFLSSGSCSRGESCKFRHDTDNKNPLSKGACFDFISKGKCERGAECKFRHSSDDGGNSDLLPPGICFDFVKKGRCDKGDDCRFSHDPDAGKKRRNTVSNTHQPCWFCLSSPNLDTHLVVSVGDNFYCALAKGPLVEEHVLIVPIEHLPSTLSLPSDADSDLQRLTHALKRYFRKHGNAMIVFERYLNLRTANHAHLQVVPIPLSKASAVRSEFLKAGKKLGFEFDVIRPAGENDIDVRMSLKKVLHGGMGYFFVELPEGTILAHSLAPEEKMPIQFGREVLASLLGKTGQSDWRDCKYSKEDETSMAEDFKKRFEPFDPVQST